jgi:hypothetical protein
MHDAASPTGQKVSYDHAITYFLFDDMLQMRDDNTVWTQFWGGHMGVRLIRVMKIANKCTRRTAAQTTSAL